MEINFDEKAALVTGSSRGFGLATAEAFLAAGARVMLNGTQPEKLRKTVSNLQKRFKNVSGCLADITTSHGAEYLITETREVFGRIDILVNNAGTSANTSFLEISENEWDQVLSLNLKGAFLVSQEFAKKAISDRTGGKIINILSGNYLWTRAGSAHYSASKAALEILTRTMAIELGPHEINVNGVAPGLMDLSKRGGRGPAKHFVDIYLKGIPLSRIGQVEDVTGAVLFLSSRHADFITGSTLLVDGGYAAGRMDLPLAPPPKG